MGESANFRDAIVGSFPAVTACAHATIGTGSSPTGTASPGTTCDEQGLVRKAYDTQGRRTRTTSDPDARRPPARADRAWVSEIGYQVWHSACSSGGRDRELTICRSVCSGTRTAGARHGSRIAPGSTGSPPDALARRLHQRMSTSSRTRLGLGFAPVGRQSPCCRPPIVRYQGDVIEAAFDWSRSGTGRRASCTRPTSHPTTGRLRHGLEMDWL